MPVVGFISADGTSDQPEGMGHCSFDFALRLAESGTSEAFPYPYPVLKGIADAMREERNYISVTTILHCLRAAFLKRTEPYYITVDSGYAMFRGTLFHSLMEKNPNPNGRIEEKVTRSHKGIDLTGTFDSIIRSQDASGKWVLQDWKTTENLPKYDSPYSAHLAQINLYRWLLGLDPKEVIMEVWYFSMKGIKQCRLKDGSTVSRNGRVVNQHWSDEKVEAFLDDRLLKMKASMMLGRPVPYDKVPQEDLWECEYCPVIKQCREMANLEREAQWRKNAGLPPQGTVGDVSAEWETVMDNATRVFTQSRFKNPQSEPVVIESVTIIPISPVPKPEPKKRGRPRKVND